MKSERPKWVTDDHLAEMRRLRHTSWRNTRFGKKASVALQAASMAHSGDEWCMVHMGHTWLTESGHRALLMIEEAESVLNNPVQVRSPTSHAHGFTGCITECLGDGRVRISSADGKSSATVPMASVVPLRDDGHVEGEKIMGSMRTIAIMAVVRGEYRTVGSALRGIYDEAESAPIPEPPCPNKCNGGRIWNGHRCMHCDP